MFIQTEATPNPATLKFLPGRNVVGDHDAVEYRADDEDETSPLASRLFEIDGISSVFLGSDFISVTKSDGEWPHLKPAILGAIMEHDLSGEETMGSEGDVQPGGEVVHQQRSDRKKGEPDEQVAPPDPDVDVGKHQGDAQAHAQLDGMAVLTEDQQDMIVEEIRNYKKR